MPASITLNRQGLERLLSRVGGAGNRLLLRRAERVADLARTYAAGHGSIPEGIVVGPVEGKSVKVISTNPNTLFVHDGTPRHPIRPRRAGGWLRFTVDGRVVFAREVNHPGYEGDPFLTKALRDA